MILMAPEDLVLFTLNNKSELLLYAIKQKLSIGIEFQRVEYWITEFNLFTLIVSSSFQNIYFY